MFTIKATRYYGRGRDQVSRTEVFECRSFEDSTGGCGDLRSFVFLGATHPEAVVGSECDNGNTTPSIVMYIKNLNEGRHGDEDGQSGFYDEIIIENASGKTTHIARSPPKR